MKSFDPNWNTKAIIHHLAPQTYLRGWKHGKSSVYYIDNNNANIKGDLSRNTVKIAYINDFFSKKAGIFFQGLSDCEKYFKPLKGYTVKYNGQFLKNALEMNNVYSLYDEWKIWDSNSKFVSKEEKETLKSEIDKIQNRNIEVGWDRLSENDWPQVKEDILNAISSNKGVLKITSVRREEFVKFMVSLEWRTKPNHPVLEEAYTKVESIAGLDKVMNDLIPENERIFPFIDTEKENFIHSKLLELYHQFLIDKGPIYNETQYIINKMNIELLVADKGSEFITSDNPVCRFTNGDKTEYIFPITPEVACAVRKGTPYDVNHYFINYLSKDEVFKYNQKLKDNCYKGYVLRQPSLTYYFK